MSGWKRQRQREADADNLYRTWLQPRIYRFAFEGEDA
jgi:hypothetical protein